MNLDSHISRIDLIGKDAIILKDGKQITEFKEGILPWSIQNPVALVFDEYDAGRPDVMFVIQRVLEAEGNFTLLDKNKVIKQNKYFRDLKKDILQLHIAHNEGNYFCSDDELKSLEDNNQIAVTYCGEDGTENETTNPNGAIKNIAGIFNKNKNVLGMMPHPERMIDKYLSGEDGSLFFKNILDNFK